jgi:hypothetical protein
MAAIQQAMDVANVRRLVALLISHFSEVGTPVREDPALRQAVFVQLQAAVRAAGQGSTLFDINAAALRGAREAVLARSRPPAPPPHVGGLDRMLEAERVSRVDPPAPPVPKGLAPLQGRDAAATVEDPDSFMQRVQRLAEVRDQQPLFGAERMRGEAAARSEMGALATHPKELYTSHAGGDVGGCGRSPWTMDPAVGGGDSSFAAMATAATVSPAAERRRNLHYITISSAARNWIAQPGRYRMQVRFSWLERPSTEQPVFANNPTVPGTASLEMPGMPNVAGYVDNEGVTRPAHDSGAAQGSQVSVEPLRAVLNHQTLAMSAPRGIHRLAVTKVLVPMEIPRSSSAYLSKTTYNHEFSMAFQYALLVIDELVGVFSATDPVAARAFCQLVYLRSYCSTNGRGYLVLEPAQRERRTFAPPLPSLGTLTISLLKPNGELFNRSADSYRVHRVQYSNLNRLYLLVLTDKYFDTNEFFVGDYVAIRGFRAYRATEAQSGPASEALTEFINREEGHEVVQVLEANDNGYHAGFYITAPGAFDAQAGAYVVDTDQVAAASAFDVAAFVAGTESVTNGAIINLSLQVVVTMSAECEA